jgi:hypothetical protein
MAGTAYDVYEPLADGSGLEAYADCLLCGGKATRPLSVYRNHWDNPVSANEVVNCNVGFAGGWSVITGGIKEYRFVLTNANDPTETTTIIVPVTGDNSGVKKATPAAYGENRGWSGKSINVADWSNVNGVDFIGDAVKVTVYAVSKADPTADPILLESNLGPVKPAHTIIAGGWDEATQQYKGACGCGFLFDVAADANTYFEAENMTIGGVWGTGQRVETVAGATGMWVQSNGNAGAWGNTYFGLNPAGAVTGQYLVFRYRLATATANNTLKILTGGGNGYQHAINVPLTVSDEWQIVVVDLAAAGYNANSVFTNGSRLDLTDWGAGEGIHFDWFRLYDTYDHIPAEYITTLE